MKKLLSFLLVAVMLCSLALPCFATLPMMDVPVSEVVEGRHYDSVFDILEVLFTDGRNLISNKDFLRMSLCGGIKMQPDDRWKSGKNYAFLAPYREMIAVVDKDTVPDEFDFGGWLESVGVNSKYVNGSLIEVIENGEETKSLVFSVLFSSAFFSDFDVFNTFSPIDYIYLYATVLSSAEYRFEYRDLLIGGMNSNYFMTAVSKTDVNYDGRFTSKDILALKQYISGDMYIVNAKAADQDGNGRITSADVILLKLAMS